METLFDEIIGQEDGQIKIAHVLDAYKKKKNLVFIEVGAHNGHVTDHLYKRIVNDKWSGVFIEPIGASFKALKKNFKGIDGLSFERIAISRKSGSLKMWVPLRSSLAGCSIYRHHPPIKKKSVKHITVACKTLNFVAKKYNLTKIDVLQVDTEGHDFEVLKSLDLGKHLPVIIHYEHRHLCPVDKAACEKRLQSHGYTFFFNKNNTIAAII